MPREAKIVPMSTPRTDRTHTIVAMAPTTLITLIVRLATVSLRRLPLEIFAITAQETVVSSHIKIITASTVISLAGEKIPVVPPARTPNVFWISATAAFLTPSPRSGFIPGFSSTISSTARTAVLTKLFDFFIFIYLIEI